LTLCSEDDEDEEDEGHAPTAAAASSDQPAGEEQGEGEENPVKMEGVEAAPKPKVVKKETSPHELKIYQTDELRKMRKDELTAEVSYLEGKSSLGSSSRVY